MTRLQAVLPSNRGLILGREKRPFIFSHASMLVVPVDSTGNSYPRSTAAGVWKWPPPSNADVENECSCVSPSPHLPLWLITGQLYFYFTYSPIMKNRVNKPLLHADEWAVITFAQRVIIALNSRNASNSREAFRFKLSWLVSCLIASAAVLQVM